MKLRQIISGALAFAITANSMSFLNSSLSASAETREEWKGYEESVSYDTWDGTYDTSWFTKYAGTKDDPYIIDSAEALMGIQKKTYTLNAATDNQAADNTIYSLTEDLDYFGISKNAKYAVPKNTTVRNVDSWYSYTWATTPFSYSYNVSYTYDTQDIIAGATEYKHHYITQVFLDLIINGKSKTIDITDYVHQGFLNSENNSLFCPFEETTFPSESVINNNAVWGVYTSVTSLDSAITSVKNSLRWYAPVSEGQIYVYRKTSTYEYNLNEEDIFYLPVGTTSEFDIVFPTITATNAAGDTITIDASNKDEYYLNAKTNFRSSSQKAPLEVTTKTTIDDSVLPLSLGSVKRYFYFSDTALDDETDNGTYSEYTAVSNKTLEDIQFYHTSGGPQFYYWQDKDSTIEFDKDEHFYSIINWDIETCNNKDFFYFTYSCNVTLNTNSIIMDMTCKDKEGKILKTWTETQTFSSGLYNLYKDFYLDVTYASNGTVNFKPYLKLARLYNGRYYNTSISLSQFTDSTPASISLDDVDNLIIEDENGNTYNYSDIASDIVFIGRGQVTTDSHRKIVKRNIFFEDTLPVIASENDNDNPTFEGKYFKLTTDVSFEENEIFEPVFPYCAEGENNSSGMSADFDMDGHVICASSTLFGNITEKGRLHNGIFTFQKYTIVNDIITDNYGLIEDISLIPYNAFNMDNEVYNMNVGFVTNNVGIIKNVKFVTCDYANFCNNNLGLIDGLDVLYTFIPDATSYKGYTMIDYVVYYNVGELRNVTIDADRDNYHLLDTTGEKWSLYSPVNYNYGVIDTFEVKDFSVITDNQNFRPVFGTGSNALFENITYSYSHLNNSNNSILPQKQDGDYKNIRYVNLTITGYHDCSSVTQSSYGTSYFSNEKFIDSNIDITVSDINNMWNELITGFFVNSKISIKSESEPDSNANEPYFSGNLINSELYLSHAFSNYSYGVLNQGWLQDSYIHIGKLISTCLVGDSSSERSGIKNCIWEVDEAADIGQGRYMDYFSNEYDLTKAIGTDFIYHNVTGSVADNFGGNLKECRVWLNYTGNLKADSSNTNYSQKSKYEDCEFYFTFDDSANGEIAALLYSTAAASDTFVYVDEMPDALTLKDETLIGLNYALNNVSIIAPKVNLHPDVTCLGILGNGLNSYTSLTATSNNVNLIANIIIPEESAVENITAYDMCYMTAHTYPTVSNMYPIIHGMNATVNVYDKNGIDSNVPVYAINGFYSNYIDGSRINNIIFRSNTTSSHSALLGANRSSIKDLAENKYRKPPLFWNCYMNLPNAQTESIPSEEAEFSTTGFLTVSEDEYTTLYESDKVYPSMAHYAGNIHYSRCYIPEGQSAVSTYFSSDSSIKDSWGLTDDYEALPDGVTEISADADSNGELAYMLDKGYAGVRRTYNWSVIEPNTVIYNSFNNEPLYTLPEITWGATHAIPDRCFEGEVNLNPVFKTTVKEANDGYIKAVGIGGSTTTNGDIYVKQGAYVVEEAKPTNDEVALIYATQKLGDAIPVKIPNTPRASAYSLRARSVDNGYDITGYTQQGIDTELTPVFKTARYISVDIENSENGTVIPSAYVSAEGEKITVSIQSETGYIVNNIKINGQPLTESFFFMPNEDVLITGECVPFEGGISKFSLFGIAGEIDQIAKTITVNVPKSQYVNNALPVIEYYGDYIVPSVSTRTDFTSPVDYTVYYGNNQSVTYKVTVNQSEYTMKIYDFVINGVHGKIDQANRKISIGLPAETDLRNLVPEDIAYSAESISPAVNEARDFTVDQIYTLYTTGMTPVSYVVDVYSADEDTAKLTKFVVSGYEGVIDEENLTVTLTVPEGLDLTNVIPDLIEYEGKKISPSKVTAVDLNNAEYDITSQSGVVNTYTIKVNYISDDEAHIDRFVLAGEEGVIDEDEKTITVEISRSVNITGITPDVIEYTGKSIYPSDDEEQDFTLPVTYTVVAPDNTEVSYEIVVEYLENKADLLEFAILGYEGVIDQDKKTVSVNIPYGIDVTDTPPSKLVVSTNATVNPTIVEHQDFTKPVVYTVTSQDKLVTNDYTINVTIERPSTIAEITEFKIDEYEGEINQEDGIITVTLPFDYPTEELEDKVPEIVWSGESITPDEDEAQDFTKPVEYIVKAEDPDVSKDYDIIIKYEDAPYIPSKEAKITEFKIDEYPGEINEEDGIITVTLPYDYPEEELENKVPEIKWIGEDITPDENIPQDFTKPVEYTVTAEDPTITKDYDIVIEYEDKPVVPSEPDKTAKIIEFKIDEYPGVIDEEDGIITVELPYDYPEEELKDKVPEIVWVGKDIEPDDDEAQDFTKPVEYTVTAEDPTIIKEYDIVIEYEDPSTDAKIIEFYIDSYKGEIDEENGIITVTVPYNYPNSELENKVPSIIWVGENITPNEDEAQDFTEDVKYTVTAQDPSVKKNYDIVVKHAEKPVTPVIPTTPEKDKDAKIIEFYIDEHKAEIDQDKGIITIILPADYPEEELKNKVPEIIWVGEDIEPDDDEAQDFTKPLSYTVTAEDPTISKKYDIIVEFAPEDIPDVDEIPDEEEEEDEEIPSEDPVEEDETPEEDEEIPEEDDEEIEEDDGPVPTGIALSFVPFIVSAVTVVVSGKMGKKNSKDDK